MVGDGMPTCCFFFSGSSSPELKCSHVRPTKAVRHCQCHMHSVKFISTILDSLGPLCLAVMPLTFTHDLGKISGLENKLMGSWTYLPLFATMLRGVSDSELWTDVTVRRRTQWSLTYMTVSVDFALFFERCFLQTTTVKLPVSQKHATDVGVLILVTGIINSKRHATIEQWYSS